MGETAERPLSPTELLTEQFYRWEMRGRGWTICEGPVDLEPPFRPFLGHYLPRRAVLDDGVVETGLSRLADKFLRWTGNRPSGPPPEPEPEEEEPEPQAVAPRGDLVEFQTLVPADLNIPREAFNAFLASLSLCREPVTFELLGTTEHITAQFAVHPDDAPHVRQQLNAFFPDAVFLPKEGTLEAAWNEGESAVVEFGLGKEFMLPLVTGTLDPFVGIIGALSELRPDELGLFQVIFQPVCHPWDESILRAVSDNAGGEFFVNAPELLRESKRKVAAPLYAAVVRIATQGPDFDRAWEVARNMAGPLAVFADPVGNELIPLKNDEYPFEEHVEVVLRRQCWRPGMILNSEELIGFVHLPAAEVRSPKLARQRQKSKAAPKAVANPQGLFLGDTPTGKKIDAEGRLVEEGLLGDTPAGVKIDEEGRVVKEGLIGGVPTGTRYKKE